MAERVVQGTLSADSMDQGTGSCSQRGSKPSSNVVVKLEPAWSMKEEPQDEPSAVYSTVQPMSDNTSGSLSSLNSSHVCQHCFATFVLFSSLELHMATFHGETLHKAFPVLSPSNCDVGCQFDDETDLLGVYGNKTAARERRRKGNDSDRTDKEKKMKKHVCEECGRGFALTGDLKKHVLIHTGVKPFVCDFCDKAFTQSGNLTIHRMIHLGDKPYVCNVCSKAFIQACNLKKHKLVHTNYRPFACDVCSKTFTRAADLKRHGLIHTGDKPHICDICSKAFNQKSALYSHQLIHSGLKAFVCDKCSNTVMRPGDVRKQKSFVCEECSQ
ncbi:hypothetical protein ACOMHN_017085 [Nucella lapillus]